MTFTLPHPGPARQWRGRARRTILAGIVVVSGLLPVPRLVVAQTLSATSHTEAVPAEFAPDIAAALAPGGVRAQIDKAAIEFWWVTAVAHGQGPPAATGAWQRVPQGALIGAMRIAAPLRDIRGRVIPAGLYTLRFGLQPANGDHLGVSPHREFLLASPAAVDRDVAPVGYDRAVDRSRQAIGTSHPAVLSIDPPEASESMLQVRANDEGHQAVIIALRLEDGGGLTFGLILVGRIEA